jgi:hypothetical protein
MSAKLCATCPQRDGCILPEIIEQCFVINQQRSPRLQLLVEIHGVSQQSLEFAEPPWDALEGRE